MNGNGGSHVASRPSWGAVRPIYTNTHTVGATKEVVRITFGEGFGTEEGNIFHTAVIMGRQDAEILAKSLLGILAKEIP
jgi:hypothetical protein